MIVGHGPDALAAAPAGASPGRVSGADMQQLHRRYPPGWLEPMWRATRQDADLLLARMLEPPCTAKAARVRRRRGLVSVIGWLADHPGRTWQERWQASGADALGNADWWRPSLDRLQSGSMRRGSSVSVTSNLRVSLNLLACADAIRPGLGWLLTPFAPHHLAADMARVRDPEGFADLSARLRACGASSTMTKSALRRAATILAAKGGLVADITVGTAWSSRSCKAARGCGARTVAQASTASFTRWALRRPNPPSTLRAFATQGQLSPQQMLDRYGIECAPVRQMLNEYLLERAPSLDHTTLRGLALTLGRLFWADLEAHHPGIDSLQLAPRRRRRLEAAERAHARRATDRGPGRRAAASAFNGRAVLSRSGPSTSIWPSGPTDDPPAGGPGRCGLRSAATPPTRSRDTASPAWTRAPANGCRCCRAGRLGGGRARATAELLAAAEAAPRRAVHLPRRGAPPRPGPVWPPPGAGPRTPTPAAAVTSAAKNTGRSGPGPWSRCCATPGSASRN